MYTESTRVCSSVQQSSTDKRKVADIVRSVVRSGGIGSNGIYRGLMATSFREIPSFGLYFVAYEYISETLVKVSCNRFSSLLL